MQALDDERRGSATGGAGSRATGVSISGAMLPARKLPAASGAR
jgi:hypothetical protein